MNYKISKKKAWVLSIAVAAIPLVIFTAFQPSEQKEEPEHKKAVEAVTYATSPVQLMNPEYEISVPAELEPYEQVAVYAKVAGFVKQLYVDRGDHVQSGQLLATLEAPEMEQQYLSDKSTEQKMYNDYLYAKQAYERLTEASKTTGAVADIELDRARSTMEGAKSAYEASMAGTAGAAQLQQYLRITAPFDGVITDRNVSVGALAGFGSNLPLFRMAQDNKLRLALSLPEKHASSVKEDTEATFTVSSRPGKTFGAVLSRTSGLLNQQDRSLKLEFDVDNSSGDLQGGDYAQVKIKLQRKNPSHWVPSGSVLHTLSGSYIMTFNNNEVKRIPVKEGLRLDSLSEVFGNLSAEDKVILKPSEEIREGQIEN